ncbi:MAG: UDP-2,4-diacetamido-2,4,6-trideoxy-beta-L-altropyranose hydrolase [Hydrogenobacter thermophilus]|nr:UDP-2,4-diacetamido-2,4,6-trideoxy-beta-L-altropyranose hydrolase [Hydrogenobacter thermophilus]
MRVKFFTEGGKGIGFGHLMRCLSLCQAFEEVSGECLFVIRGTEEVRTALNRPLKLLDWLEDIELFERELKDAHLIVIDSYLAKPEHYEISCKKAGRNLFIDDFGRMAYPCGYVLNGSVYAKDLNYPQRRDVVYLLGSEYTPLRRAFWEVQQKEIREKVEKVLITFGGDDSKGMTRKVVNALEREFPYLEKLVVVGSSYKNREELYALASEKVKIYENLPAEGMKNLMLKADIAISAGGQTTYELAAVGVPSVLVAVADNQLLNCKSWHKEGFALYAGWWEDENIEEMVLAAVEKLLKHQLRLFSSTVGRRLVDGQGARRVAHKIS